MANTPTQFGPPPGQTALDSLPQYGGAGGSQQAADYYAGQDFFNMFGRNPTASELAQLSGAYMSGDPNRANTSGGKAAVAQYYNANSMTPANLYSQQQQQWSTAAPQHYDAVNSLFKQTLGRAPNQDELSHYGTLLASGQADPYQLTQFLQSLPEYQNTQDTQFRQGLDTQMQQSDQNFFNTTKGNIAQQYALMGRSTSPALDVALTDFATQLSNNRQNFMSQLSASQYGQNKSAAMGNYGQTQNDVYGRINQNPGYQYQNQLALQNRVQNISDYATQAQNYGNMMDRYGNKGPGPLDYLNLGLNGANAGANVGRAWAGH